MQVILFFTDLTLAVLVLIAGPVAGVKAARPWLYALAALALARLVVALVLLAGGGWLLVDSRLTVQVPLALLPALWAASRPSRTAAHVAAAASVLSVWWLLAPFAPQDTTLVIAGSVAALGMIAGLSVAVGRWRESPSRLAGLPWLTVAFLLVPATTLALAGQANASATDHRHGGTGQLSVEQLTGPKNQTPDVRTTLTAAKSQVKLASGATVEALTFNGTAPGPEIRLKKGQLLEVTLINTNVAEGVTTHWHGVDLPNAEDGVPGVTQDAVMPGGRHVYRFVPTREGTFWYHTHLDGLLNVRKGLFGALIVEPPAKSDELERTVFTHSWAVPGGDARALNLGDRPARQDAPAGRNVRVRAVNSSQEPQTLQVGGAPGASLTFSPDGTAGPVATTGGGQFDPLTYGAGPAPAAAPYQKTFDLRLDDGFGFSQGSLGYVSSLINGRLYPAVPTLEVARGDRVKVRIASRSTIEHPFHLHGHRVRVISRNGDPATGSPWYTDTLNIGTGEVYEIEFLADNPGIWMDHCHNFQHGANGMILHLAYRGVTTPYSSDHSPE